MNEPLNNRYNSVFSTFEPTKVKCPNEFSGNIQANKLSDNNIKREDITDATNLSHKILLEVQMNFQRYFSNIANKQGYEFICKLMRLLTCSEAYEFGALGTGLS